MSELKFRPGMSLCSGTSAQNAQVREVYAFLPQKSDCLPNQNGSTAWILVMKFEYVVLVVNC